MKAQWRSRAEVRAAYPPDVRHTPRSIEREARTGEGAFRAEDVAAVRNQSAAAAAELQRAFIRQTKITSAGATSDPSPDVRVDFLGLFAPGDISGTLLSFRSSRPAPELPPAFVTDGRRAYFEEE